MNNSSLGFLIINVRYANGAAPVSGAVVALQRNGSFVGEFLTDNMGKTQKIPLEAAEDYGGEVYADGFEKGIIAGIPIISRITTLQNICLFPQRNGGDNSDGQI